MAFYADHMSPPLDRSAETGFQAALRLCSKPPSMLHQLTLSSRKQVVHDIICGFRDDTISRLFITRCAVVASDLAAATREVHLARSSAALLGADHILCLDKHIEVSATEGERFNLVEP
jgi:hypothetical protein